MVLVLPDNRFPIFLVARLDLGMCMFRRRTVGKLFDLVLQPDVLECERAIGCVNSVQLFVGSEEVPLKLRNRVQGVQ